MTDELNYGKMKSNLLKKKSDRVRIQNEYDTKGEKHATEANEMVDFGQQNGWDNWKGKEPGDKRDHLADRIIELLKDANSANKVKLIPMERKL